MQTTGAKAGRGGVVDRDTPALQSAQSCAMRGDLEGARALYEKAVADDPRNLRVLMSAGSFFADIWRIERSEYFLGKAESLVPDDPVMNVKIGEAYARIRKREKATAAFEKAFGLCETLPIACMKLAEEYELAHRYDDSREMIDRALELLPGYPMVLLILARVEQHEGQLEESEKTLRSIIDSAPENDPMARKAWMQLAGVKDRMGQYDDAFDAATRSKPALDSEIKKHIAAATEHFKVFDQLSQSLTRADSMQWQVQAGHLDPQRVSFLTGFLRSGTTLLEHVLDAHPDIISSEEKGVISAMSFAILQQCKKGGTFLESMNGLTDDQISQGRKSYFESMQAMQVEPINGRMHLDKNPSFMRMAPIMARYFPEVRILVALRDPRDVVLSCYMRYEGGKTRNPSTACFRTLQGVAERYCSDMTGWLRYRETLTSPWCEIRYEDTVRDLESQARRAVEFLGLAWDDRVLQYRDKPMNLRLVGGPNYDMVSKPIYTSSVARWKNYEPQLEPVMDMLNPFVKAFGYDC